MDLIGKAIQKLSQASGLKGADRNAAAKTAPKAPQANDDETDTEQEPKEPLTLQGVQGVQGDELKNPHANGPVKGPKQKQATAEASPYPAHMVPPSSSSSPSLLAPARAASPPPFPYWCTGVLGHMQGPALPSPATVRTDSSTAHKVKPAPKKRKLKEATQEAGVLATLKGIGRAQALRWAIEHAELAPGYFYYYTVPVPKYNWENHDGTPREADVSSTDAVIECLFAFLRGQAHPVPVGYQTQRPAYPLPADDDQRAEDEDADAVSRAGFREKLVTLIHTLTGVEPGLGVQGGQEVLTMPLARG